MKKHLIIFGTIILSLLITFLVADIFSLYHFGDIPTLTTFCYLLSIFSILEYTLVALFYIVNKLIHKEKLGLKKFISLILFFGALLLVLGFIVILDIDWLNHYMYSSPFYVNVIVRSLELLLPSILLIIIGIFMFKK